MWANSLLQPSYWTWSRFLRPSVTHTSLINQFTLRSITVLRWYFTCNSSLLRICSSTSLIDQAFSSHHKIIMIGTFGIVHCWDRWWNLKSIIRSEWSCSSFNVCWVEGLVSKTIIWKDNVSFINWSWWGKVDNIFLPKIMFYLLVDQVWVIIPLSIFLKHMRVFLFGALSFKFLSNSLLPC